MTRRYALTHRTEYAYDRDVDASYGRAHLVPRSDCGQRRLSAEVLVDPDPDELREHTDFFGNRSTYFAVRRPHRRLVVTARSQVAVDRAPPEPDAFTSLGWEYIRDRLDEPAEEEVDLDARTFRLASPLIPRGAAGGLTTCLRPGTSLGEAIDALLTRIAEDFTYVTGATTVHTPIAEVLARREGVCQDFAHLAVGALRYAGLSARYVSGYLETAPPPGRPRLIGSDASHAWASVFAPSLGWIDFDPTNRKFVDDGYVVAAIGRDYGDVPPLKGVIFTESLDSTMSVSVDMAPTGERAVDHGVADASAG